ncbi:MAG: hypothetical protein JO364_08355 [Pseudonocardiales bacterium]|nr:hypothetical protein [Pseudonocardiales bacterium]MBV9030310.1 hypothetical protein [Pseudonocardiales bacterium]
MTDNTNDLPTTRWPGKYRRVIPATCAPHRGPVAFTILVLSIHGGVIALNPHAAGARKVTLDEDGARVLRSALTEWLG